MTTLRHTSTAEDRPLVIRSYTKSELAGMYLPTFTPRVALRKFNKWLRLDPTIWEELSRTGFVIKNRVCTRKQVEIIVRHLGEP